MMDYQGNIIRPPSEAESIILQVTVGCSHNKCTFCGAYKGVKFKIKDEETIEKDLDFASVNFHHVSKLFLADGDVLILPQHRLVQILKKIKEKLPQVKRIRLYGNCKSIRSKSVSELSQLKELGLDRIYMGLESGNDEILKRIRKGSSAEQMINAANKVNQAGIFLSITVLLGIAGKEKKYAKQHSIDTANILNKMSPKQIAALTVMPIPGTVLHNEILENKFKMPGQIELLHELKSLIKGITLDRVQFQANHASNYLPINCRLQKDKQKILILIDKAISGKLPLMPEYMRAL